MLLMLFIIFMLFMLIKPFRKKKKKKKRFEIILDNLIHYTTEGIGKLLIIKKIQLFEEIVEGNGLCFAGCQKFATLFGWEGKDDWRISG